MTQVDVWLCDDLRKEIFSYLRKRPILECTNCKKVLIWDRKVNDYIMMTWIHPKPTIPHCMKCWYDNYNGPGCLIT